MERRRRSRFIERNDVIIRPASPNHNGQKSKAQTLNISTGGARLLTKEPFDVGTVLKIHIDLARTHQSVTLDGEVKWLRFNQETDLFELGVEFVHLTSRKVLTLIRHLYCRNGRAATPEA